MRGIRQRNKHLIAAGLSGAAIMGLPLLIVVWVLALGNLAARRQAEQYEKQQEGLETCIVYVLNKDKARGERIEGEDITGIEMMKSKEMNSLESTKQVIGKMARLPLCAGTVLSEAVVQAEEPLADDVRRLELSYVELPLGIKEGEFVDIRIEFPNGEDYIVVGQRNVLSLTVEEGYGGKQVLEIYVNEEELLKLASAKTDCTIYPESRIYAVCYAEAEQAMAQDTYPVNPYVYELSQWDPNVVESLLTEENMMRRQTLESHMQPKDVSVQKQMPY